MKKLENSNNANTTSREIPRCKECTVLKTSISQFEEKKDLDDLTKVSTLYIICDVLRKVLVSQNCNIQ